MKKNINILKTMIIGIILIAFIMPSTGIIIKEESKENLINDISSVENDLSVYLGSCYWTITGEELAFIATANGGSGNYQYKWNFGDGSSTNWLDSSSITHTYSLPTGINYAEYTIKVDVKDDEESTSSCEEPVEVVRYPLLATLNCDNLEGQTGYEFEIELQFGGSKPVYDGGNYDYCIDWGDGTEPYVEFDAIQCPTISHIYSEAGAYTITSYVEDSLICPNQIQTNDLEIEIIESDIGSVSINLPTCYVIRGEDISMSASANGGSGNYNYKWTFGDGSSTNWLTSNTITHEYYPDPFFPSWEYFVFVEVKNDGEEPPAPNPHYTSGNLLVARDVLWATLDTPDQCEVGSNIDITINFGGGISPYKYHLNWGDSTEEVHSDWLDQGQGITLFHTYTERSLYTITVVVQDSLSCTDDVTTITQVGIYDDSIKNTRTGQTYPSIQAAIDDAIWMDTITVASGEYSDNPYDENTYINIDKTITLKGEDPETTIIDGSSCVNVVEIHADDVTIEGFNITGGSYAGIKVFREIPAARQDIRHNIVYNNKYGILVHGESPSHLNHVVDIFNNTIIHNTEAGIYLEYATNIDIEKNTITQSINGIYVKYSDHIDIFSNIISYNGYSNIQILGSSGKRSEYNNIYDNKINHAGDLGIIIFDYSSYNTVTGNTISDNERGLGITDWTYDNIIYNNNFFLNNIRHAFDNSGDNIWYSDSLNHGNYWDDHESDDLFSGSNQDQPGSDGVGDIPYTLDYVYQDIYPLIHPFGSIINKNTDEIFLIIGDAIADPDTSDGDTIIVQDGLYYVSNIYDGSLVIDKAITLQGVDKTRTIIDGCLYDGDVIKVTSNDVTISGFTIQNSGYSTPTNQGIYIFESAYININNNTIKQNGIGVSIYECGGNIIENNTLIDNGIGLSSACNNIIQNNYLDGDGIGLSNAWDNIILNNQVINADNAIILVGAFSTNCYDNTISKNTLQNNNKGIYLYKINWGGGNTFSENTIQNNVYGVHSKNSENNYFFYNNFIENSLYSALEEESINIWDDQIDMGNYWDDFETNPGYPNYYRIPGGDNQDNYPLTQQWPPVLCGDANGDGTVNVSDAVYLINYVFIGGPAPECNPINSCGDANCDGAVNVSDAVWIINYVFVGGPAPCDC